jgi:hypothetical protein
VDKKIDRVSKFKVIHDKWRALGVDLFHRVGTEEQLKAYDEELDIESDRIDQLTLDLINKHPLRNKVNKRCEVCGGKGEVPTTYNPLSRWDWWSIGGRWTGTFTDYKPEKDPDNIERCQICGGSGKRTDGVMELNGMTGCNGCQGTGKTVKWPTQWKQFEGDIRPVSALDKKDPSCAVVTPSGRWHERERGFRDTRAVKIQTYNEWAKKFKRLLNTYKNNWAVAVDCHI